MLILIALLWQLAAPIVYVPETIDSLWESTATTVQLAGTVTVVSVTTDATQRPVFSFMLGDGHGHFVKCILPHSEPQAGPTPYVDQPRVGLAVIVFGTRVKYSVETRGQGAVEIDPVTAIRPVTTP